MAGPTKAELQAELDERGIAYPEDATNADLEALLEGPESTAGGADGVVDGHHAASEVRDAAADEKPGPGSVMSREIRPDERDLPAGTSALQ